jgi:hypothetical protein
MADEAIARAEEAMKRSDEAIARINGSNTNSTTAVQTKPVSYTLADAFASGTTFLPGSAEDFVKITYDFSTDCDSENGWDLAFNPHYADSVPVHLPRSILPDERLETRRSCNWRNRWQYDRIQRAKAEFFVSKENLAKAGGTLENAIKEISGNIKLETYYEGHKECCYGKVYVVAKSADGKRFEYDLKRSISQIKPTPENLSYLRDLYEELGKKTITAHLDKSIAAIEANIGGKTFNEYYIDSLNRMDNMSFAHPLLRTKLKDLDTQASELAVLRDKEIDTLTELYGSNLTQESLADKRKGIIQKYDPKIAELGEQKYELTSPLRSVKEIIAKLGDKDIRTLSRSDYIALNRAVRVSNNYPLDTKTGVKQ